MQQIFQTASHNLPVIRGRAILSMLAYAVLILLYAAYIFFITTGNRSGVDYHTFISAGARWSAGEPVYTENSYYPMAYVLVFAFFAALPGALSILIWHLAPILVALSAARWSLWPLAFAPLFAHLLGGQTAVVGLLAIYGYIHWRGGWRAGVALAIATLKPQLVLLPLVWVGASWMRDMYRQRRIPPQMLAFAATTALLYLPAFALYPGWVGDWLASPRPLFERAIAAPVPRLAVMLFGDSAFAWGVIIAGMSAFALACLRHRPSFEVFVLGGLVVTPFVHDYDLILVIPLIAALGLQRAALAASIPLWLTIALAYTNDQAWTTVTLIPLALAIASLRSARAGDRPAHGASG